MAAFEDRHVIYGDNSKLGFAQVFPINGQSPSTSSKYSHAIVITSIGETKNGEQVHRDQRQDINFPKNFYNEDGTLDWDTHGDLIEKHIGAVIDKIQEAFEQYVARLDTSKNDADTLSPTSADALIVEDNHNNAVTEAMGSLKNNGIIADFEGVIGFYDIQKSFPPGKVDTEPEYGRQGSLPKMDHIIGTPENTGGMRP